jgi:hypothetical protein
MLAPTFARQATAEAFRMADLIERTARSWRLIKASTAVLQDDGELLLLPILSGAATLAVGGAFVWQAMNDGTFDAFKHGEPAILPPSLYVWLFAFYLVQYFVIIFFNTALVGAAIDRLDGRDPTIRSALALAVRRIGPIFGYAIVSATVGMVLRFIGERLGLIGRLIEAGGGLAWTVMTFLVVPVLAAEGIGPVEAVRRSASLLRRTWGENIVGSAGISLVMGFVALVVGLVCAGAVHLMPANQVVAVALIVASALAFVAILTYGAALSAVYSAAVYYYAVVGEPPEGFDRDLVRSAFGPKGGD